MQKLNLATKNKRIIISRMVFYLLSSLPFFSFVSYGTSLRATGWNKKNYLRVYDALGTMYSQYCCFDFVKQLRALICQIILKHILKPILVSILLISLVYQLTIVHRVQYIYRYSRSWPTNQRRVNKRKLLLSSNTNTSFCCCSNKIKQKIAICN